MNFKIKVNWSRNLKDRYHAVERVIQSADYDANVKVLNRMLATGEISSYEVFKEPDCTCFTCDDDCDIIKEKELRDGIWNGAENVL